MSDSTPPMSNDIPPELISQLIALGMIGPQNDVINQQIEQAQGLRNQVSPRGIMAGKSFVAANPLSIIGDVWAAYRGKKQEDKLRVQQQALIQQQQAARAAFAQQLLRGRTPPTTAAPTSNDYDF